MSMDIVSDQEHGISDMIGRMQDYKCDCGITGCRTFRAIRHHDFYNVPANHYDLEFPFEYSIRNPVKRKLRDRDGRPFIKGSFKYVE